MQTTDCGIIILAAGNSSRLGEPKQLLLFNHKTLLQHTIDEAVTSGIGDVVVITGANGDSILSSLSTNVVRFVYNEQWQQGMASSIGVGLRALLSAQPGMGSVIILLCDQPYVTSFLLKEMVKQKEATGKGMAGCAYKETIGVPALFSRRYFDSLRALKGEEGAKKIIVSNREDVAVVPFPLGAVDIDTKEDYEGLIK